MSPSSPTAAAFSVVVAEPKFKLSLSASLNSMIFELDESGVLKPEAFAEVFGGVTCVGGAKGGLSGELILGGETMALDKGL